MVGERLQSCKRLENVPDRSYTEEDTLKSTRLFRHARESKDSLGKYLFSLVQLPDALMDGLVHGTCMAY